MAALFVARKRVPESVLLMIYGAAQLSWFWCRPAESVCERGPATSTALNITDREYGQARVSAIIIRVASSGSCMCFHRCSSLKELLPFLRAFGGAKRVLRKFSTNSGPVL